MGAYMSEPNKEKCSHDEECSLVSIGSSSMQGWRISQEDAHNSILDFDMDTCLFAVYDGHGGHEVAQYCAQKLPDRIKMTDAYKEGKIEKALEDTFMDIDETLVKADVLEVLKEMSDSRSPQFDEEDALAELQRLKKEAAMTLTDVLATYTTDKEEETKKEEAGDSAPGPSSAGCSSGLSSQKVQPAKEENKVDGDTCSSPSKEEGNKEGVNGSNGEVKEETDAATESICSKHDELATKGENGMELGKHDESAENGEPLEAEVSPEPEVKKGKGKAKDKSISATDAEDTPEVRRQPPRTLRHDKMYEDDEEDDEEEDESTSDENSWSTADSEEEDDEDEEEEEDDDEDEEEEDEDEEDDDEKEHIFSEVDEEPGLGSGCTAVVALLQHDRLYVANAGDSRCVLCHDGKAVNMSQDHKPEDEEEENRIIRAGGRVTADGRVDGGLNLSRAIGDHTYKKNPKLPAKEQMITAFPDVRTWKVDPTVDKFMVLACDGIWNSMSSEQVVKFVGDRIDTCDKLSAICEELFEACLSPNTLGDGTGCDNMTAIIVKFNPAISKCSVGAKRIRPKDMETEECAKKFKGDASPCQNEELVSDKMDDSEETASATV